MAKDRQLSPYAQKLLDPRWQKQRLEILNRDKWACQICFDSESTLHVHHRWYQQGCDPWDYPPECLVTLCETCHEFESDHRRAMEQLLISALQKHYFSGDVETLACAFGRSEPPHVPSVFMSAIVHAIETQDGQQALLDMYFKHLQERQAKQDQ